MFNSRGGHLWKLVRNETRTKVVHKNESQGYNKVKLHIIKKLHYAIEKLTFLIKLALYLISMNLLSTSLYCLANITSSIKSFIHKLF